MGAVKLCIHKQAKNPFFIEATGTNVYSLEELAYYLYENIYLVNEHFMDEKLYGWIEKQLELPKLAEALREDSGKVKQVYSQVLKILAESDYYSEEEMTALQEKIAVISGLQTQERMKYKADEFYGNEYYWEAITEYEKILNIRQSTKLDVTFYAKVWNNLGGCYGRVFLFEKAATCFENAYSFYRKAEYKQRAYYARTLAAHGERGAVSMSAPKGMEAFGVEAQYILKTLKKKSESFEEVLTVDEFLKKTEKQYLKNAYNS